MTTFDSGDAGVGSATASREATNRDAASHRESPTESAGDRTGADGRDVRDDFRRLEAIVESDDAAIVVKDAEGRYLFANRAAAEFVGRAESEMLGATDEELFGPEAARDLRERERAVLETEERRTDEERLPVADGERVFETTCSPYYGPDGDLAGTFSVCRDVTERHERERQLRRQRDALATFDRINRVVCGVVVDLIGEATREELERTVCDRIVDSELYRTAWIADLDPCADEVRDLVGAGLDERTPDLVGDFDASENAENPVVRAFRTGEPAVIGNVADDSSSGRNRRGILDRESGSAVAVPVRYGDATYGVLVVESDRAMAFGERESDAFATLGEVVGFAINAVKHRRLALSDAVVELEFRVAGRESVSVDLSERLGCHLRLEGTTAGTDGTLVFYQSLRGADPAAVREYAADCDAIERMRVVSDRGNEHLLEFVAAERSFVVTLSEYGARTTEAVTENGESRVVAELPAAADVREVVEGVRNAYSGVELLAKRECEREVRTASEFRRAVDERLTDAQRRALRASYLAGYYDWPRESTAEDVAESLGISSPTLHQHLRKAQAGLLEAFFDDAGEGST
ncbi:PAS domain-containing protein [Halorussus vallis]|uniref:bacterio-opsin activator domain-containing protein n=1 Tax=Halorussus vallis TaxID=2953749 RepID=UPI00209EB7DD|nr:bacterio-opsin activator domain-containing protein [Halorussus vallis]USZ75251.1 PAS domain-containing protein [Halorussus vallis]